MPMIAGDTTCVDGTLSGELYAALDGLDPEVAADTFRRALCEAFGIAIATHANETIVEAPATTTQIACYPFAFASSVSTEVFPAWLTTGEQASADTVTCRLACPYDGRVVKIMIRPDNSPGSIICRFWRATGSGSASVNGNTETASSAGAGVMREVAADPSWTFSQGDWIAIGLDPNSLWSNVDGLLVVEYTL